MASPSKPPGNSVSLRLRQIHEDLKEPASMLCAALAHNGSAQQRTPAKMSPVLVRCRLGVLGGSR